MPTQTEAKKAAGTGNFAEEVESRGRKEMRRKNPAHQHGRGHGN